MAKLDKLTAHSINSLLLRHSELAKYKNRLDNASLDDLMSDKIYNFQITNLNKEMEEIAIRLNEYMENSND